MYLITGKVHGHIEENNGNEYLVFDSTNENKEVLEKYTELWDGIKNDIETMNGGKKYEYGKDFMEIKFNTDDVAIAFVKGSACRIHFWYMSKDDAITIMKNSNLIDKKGVL